MKILKFGDRNRTKQIVGEETRTQQHLAAETDVNAIMRKYEKTGVLTHVARYAGEYGDFSGVPDYQTGLNMVMAADEMFSSLPARIRDRFNNDPARFIAFATNADNLEELRKMGLAPELPKPPEPSLVKVVSEDQDASSAKPTKAAKANPQGDQ